MEFEWNIFPGFTTLQLSNKVQELLLRLSVTPEKFTGRIILCRCSTKSHGDQRTTRKNSSQMLNSFLSVQRDSEHDNGHSLGLEQRKSGILSVKTVTQGKWHKIAEKMMVTLAESGHPVFRASSLLSRGVLKSKGGGKLSIHYCADFATIETVFRTIVSVHQLSICGAVSDLCEEFESCHDRTERSVVRRQSDPFFVPSVMKTHILWTDDPAQEEDPLQRYQERVERKVITTRSCDSILY